MVTSQMRTTAPRDCHCSAQLRPPLEGLPSRATPCRYVFTGPKGCLRWPPAPPGPRWPHSFAEISRKKPYPQTPAISRGRSEGKKESGSLAAAFGACLLRLQKVTLGSTSGRCKDVLQDMVFGSPSEAWLLMVRYHSPARPRAAGGGGP